MNEPMHGVNLGGWLVLEPWMTPSLFVGTNAVDEYTYCRDADAAARKRLKAFRDTFITEDDFIWLAEHGIQAVRLPVGYWLYGNTAPYVGTKQYVDKAFRWAQKHGLKVLLDLHGAPGSQNGEMHSGRRGKIGWHTDEANIAHTVAVLQLLAEDYGKHPALLGISVLNEAAPRIPKSVLRDFYKTAFTLLRRHCHEDAWIVCSDSFRPGRWRRSFRRKQYPGLYFDYHHYQIFSWLDKRLSAQWQLWRARYTIPYKIRRMGRHHPIVVGEWSGALRAEKAQGVSPAEYIALQKRAFGSAMAWFYWSYKTENGGAWSFHDFFKNI